MNPMDIAKQISEDIRVGFSTYKETKNEVFKHLEEKITNERDKHLTLFRVMHLVTHNDEANEQMYVRRLQEYVGIEPNIENSKKISDSVSSLNMRHVRDAMSELMQPVLEGKSEYKDVAPDIMHAISMMDSDKEQSIALRVFELMTKEKEYDPDLTM